MIRSIIFLAPALAVSFLLNGCSGPSSSADSTTAAESMEPIINGTVPSAGALETYGVVNLAGCTGTLLTNQHVLTAHHCTGRYNGTKRDWSGTLAAPGTMTISLEAATGTKFATNSTIYEPPGNTTTWTLNGGSTGDYSIIELDHPIPVSGSSDTFYNQIYTGTDSSLVGKTVLCMGYGGTTEATANSQAGGFGTLTYANMAISSLTGSTLRRNRTTGNVVGFGGDSGSTCYSSGAVTTVQSTCDSGSWFDLNFNNKDDAWVENYNVQWCDSSGPDSYRTWANGIIMTGFGLAYNFVPALSGTPTVSAHLYSRGAEVAGSPVAANGTMATYFQATRSGRVEVKTNTSPTNTMCPNALYTTPLAGSAQLRLTCLGNGLVSGLVDAALL